MKTIILALSIALMSASAFAHHTTGLAEHQGQVASTSGKSITVNGKAPVLPQAHVNRARQTNVVTDPQSCIDRWGDHCVGPEVRDPAVLDLGNVNISNEIVPLPSGEGGTLKTEDPTEDTIE